jgi:hypothetical protein
VNMGQGGRRGPGHLGNVDLAVGAASGRISLLGERGNGCCRQ